MPYLKKQALCPEPIDCKILTAALDLFVKKGYYNVSIHEIQKKSDVSIGSIYRHFNSKEGVAQALYKHILNEVNELIDGVIENTQTPVKQLEEIIRQFFEHTETHPEIMAFIFHTKHTEFLANEPSIFDATPFNRIKNIISASVQHKGAGDDVVNSIILGSVTNMIQLRLDSKIKEPLTNSLNLLLSNIWTGIENQTDQYHKTA